MIGILVRRGVWLGSFLEVIVRGLMGIGKVEGGTG